VRQALLFCLGIVVLFTAMGILVTAAVGPFGVVQLGSNPWVNAFITLVFIVFGLSLLGAFEITLPSSLLTKMDQVSQRGGYLGTLLMGLTFSLTSFACVGPFVGTLLAGSVQGGGARPAMGMMAFSSGLASPFFLLALFPAFLQRMPRSGGWLARVKVVLGFVILAAALKYLSSIDQVLQWNILTRERFLAAWVVLFALPGLYLLGFLRLEGVKADETLGVGRTLAGAAFLVFAVSLIPGMFSAPLGELDSYVPLVAERADAAGEGRSGLELYTDGTDDVSEANQKLQEARFGTAAIPYYAIFDAEGKAVATFAGLTRKAPEYLAFLKTR
jgi:thiol:disulfide interchange protein DsbD